MRKLSLCVIVTLFLMMGCATLMDLISPVHYKIFELTLDGQKVVVNLPNELPSMDKAIRAGESRFNLKVSVQRFCMSPMSGHDHVDFVYIKTDVIALVWIKSKERDPEKRFLAWAYIEKKPISVPISRIRELVKESTRALTAWAD